MTLRLVILAFLAALAHADVRMGLHVSVGDAHSCVLDKSLPMRSVRCLGNPIPALLRTAAYTGDVSDLDPIVLPGQEEMGCAPVHVIAAHTMTMIITAPCGSLFIFGESPSFGLGLGATLTKFPENPGDEETLASLVFPSEGGRVIWASSSSSHQCVTLESGQALCWGQNAVSFARPSAHFPTSADTVPRAPNSPASSVSSR